MVLSSDDPSRVVEARLTLFGFVATPVQLSVSPRTRVERASRALLSIAASIAAAPVVFFIPPHAEWVMLSLATGLYWARKHWIAEYVVASFEGLCPRCYKPLDIETGTTLRFPHGIVCYACHNKPVLELGGAPPVDESRREALIEPVRAPAERRPLRIWSPAGSDW